MFLGLGAHRSSVWTQHKLATVLFAHFDSSSSTLGRDAALVLWLFVPSAILLLFTMRLMKAEAMSLKG